MSSSLSLCTVVFETGSFTEPEAYSSDRLAGWRAPRIHLSLPHSAGVGGGGGLQVHATVPGFVCSCWQSEPGSSCLHSKRDTHSAFVLAILFLASPMFFPSPPSHPSLEVPGAGTTFITCMPVS